MENKDTDIGYQKFVRVGDQKWEIVEITIGISFLLEICIYYFLYREFSSPIWKKSPPPKVPVPTPKIPIWPKSLPYKRSEKWLSPSPLITQGGGGVRTMTLLPLTEHSLWRRDTLQLLTEHMLIQLWNPGSSQHLSNIWDKVFKNGLSKIYVRLPLTKLQWYGLFEQTISLQICKGYVR